MKLDKIVSIKKVGIRKTVDIEVDGDHLFWCNGILTHNSAAGDVTDVTEESIQGGISKIQSADNVVAFVPNSHARTAGVIRAKLLKTRDSGGVGAFIDFKTDWSTLTFAPWHAEDGDGGGAFNSVQNTYSNLPSQTGKNQTFQKQEKPVLKKAPSAQVKSDNPDTEDDEKGTVGVIRNIKGKSRPGSKMIKLV